MKLESTKVLICRATFCPIGCNTFTTTTYFSSRTVVPDEKSFELSFHIFSAVYGR